MPAREAPLSDNEPIVFPGTERVLNGSVPRKSQAHRANCPIAFDRRELTQLLGMYGRKVAEGEWRDYAIDMLREKAVFSVFRKTSEYPLYRIEKNPELARRQGAYSVVTPTGHILRRGHDLRNVLRVIDKSLRLVQA
jgi:hypothetical protein